MAQGRQALFNLLNGEVSWPPAVVPFGLDPFGWHGKQESYKNICDFALENCTLLPKVFPVSDPLLIGKGDVEILSELKTEDDGMLVRGHRLIGLDQPLFMEEMQTPGDTTWKIRKRWIENDNDLDIFLNLPDIMPAEPDIEAVREKERQVGQHGLPYVEIIDPFAMICEMFSTETFFIKVHTDSKQIFKLLSWAEKRIIFIIENLCMNAECQFILRLIGAEMAVPPFMSRDDFLRFEGNFYKQVSEIAHGYGVPVAFHCHGQISEIMDDIWEMGYSFIEPFEPLPNGNVTISEALTRSKGKGIVFGGVDEVMLNTGEIEYVQEVVKHCLHEARKIEAPYILSQTATPFYDPISYTAKENYLLFMELGIKG